MYGMFVTFWRGRGFDATLNRIPSASCMCGGFLGMHKVDTESPYLEPVLSHQKIDIFSQQRCQRNAVSAHSQMSVLNIRIHREVPSFCRRTSRKVYSPFDSTIKAPSQFHGSEMAAMLARCSHEQRSKRSSDTQHASAQVRHQPEAVAPACWHQCVCALTPPITQSCI